MASENSPTSEAALSTATNDASGRWRPGHRHMIAAGIPYRCVDCGTPFVDRWPTDDEECPGPRPDPRRVEMEQRLAPLPRFERFADPVRPSPSVGDIRLLPGHQAVQMLWPATTERPEIRMTGSHVWTGEAWLPLQNDHERQFGDTAH